MEAFDCRMSSCAAPAGSPGRTTKGKVAAQYHTARFRLVPHVAKALSVPVPRLRKPGPAWAELPRLAAGMVPAGHVRIGYARASSVRQSLDTQVDSLRPSGVTRIFSEKISTRAVTRPGLDRAVASTRHRRRSWSCCASTTRRPLPRDARREVLATPGARLAPRHGDVSISSHRPRPPRCLRRYHSMLVARKLARRCYNAIEPGPARGPAAGLRRSSMRSLGFSANAWTVKAMSVSKPKRHRPPGASHGKSSRAKPGTGKDYVVDAHQGPGGVPDPHRPVAAAGGEPVAVRRDLPAPHRPPHARGGADGASETPLAAKRAWRRRKQPQYDVQPSRAAS